MSTQLDKDTEEKGGYLVSVTDGVASGATFRVSPGQTLVVGSDLKADIVLLDSGACDCQMVLTGTNTGVMVEALAGKILLNGDALPLSTEVESDGCRLRLGEAELWIQTSQRSDSRPTAKVSASKTPVTNATSDSLTESALTNDTGFETVGLARSHGVENSVDDNAGETPTVVPVLTERSWAVPLAMVLGPVLVCAVYFSWNYPDQQNEPAIVPTLASVLEEPEFAGLSVSTSGDTSTLTGRLQSREQAKKLDLRLSSLSEKIENRTHVAEQLLAQINEIFRVNGESVKAGFTDNGDVLLETRIANPERLEHLRDVVVRDVPELPGIVIDNKPPPSELKSGKAPVVEPGKRVALVVSDEPAYVVTEDDSRYFVGAILPSGHRIHAIEGGRVSLEMQGLITELKF